MDYAVRGSIIALLCFICYNCWTVCASDETKPPLIPCKEDWFMFGDKCYKVGGKTIGLTWDEASLFCQQERGGSLASIHSKELQDFLVAHLLLDANSNVWIGLKTPGTQWVDGSNLSFENFDETVTTWKEPCAEMLFFTVRTIGKWSVEKCEKKQAYICQNNQRVRSRNLDPRFCPIENGGGWRYSDFCYNFIGQPKTWADAEKYCQNHNGHLVTVLNKRTEHFLNYILPGHKEIWVGLKTEDAKYQKWTSGWRVNLNQLNHFSPNKCITWSSENSLDSLNFKELSNCSAEITFVCETFLEPAPIEVEWECPKLSNDWINGNGEYCYLFETNKKRNWFEANYECMRKGGALATIQSGEEATLIHELAINENLIQTGGFFFGLRRSFSHKNSFEWIDGSSLLYQQWQALEPNNLNEECGDVNLLSMCWNDRSCSDEFPFICSAKKVQPKKTPTTEMEVSVPTCPSVTELRIFEKDSVCKFPQNISDIIFSALEDVDSYFDKEKLRKTIESKLKEYSYPKEDELSTEDPATEGGEFTTNTIYFTKSESQETTDLTTNDGENYGTTDLTTVDDENNKTTNLITADKHNEATDLSIDSSLVLLLTDEGKNKAFLSTLFKKADRRVAVSSSSKSSQVEPARWTETAKEHSTLMKQKMEQQNLALELMKGEYESRGNILKAQEKLITQLSDTLDKTPERVNIVFNH